MSTKLQKERLDRMLNAAMTEFSEHGFEQTSVNSIAARAAVSKATIYSHFKTKENLFLEVFEHFLNSTMLPGVQDWGNVSFEKEMKMETRLFFSRVSGSPEARFFFRCMTDDSCVLNDELRTELANRFISGALGKMENLIDARKQGLLNPRLDFAFVKYALIGVLMQSMRYLWSCEKKISPNRLADQVSEFILFGLTATKPL